MEARVEADYAANSVVILSLQVRSPSYYAAFSTSKFLGCCASSGEQGPAGYADDAGAGPCGHQLAPHIKLTGHGCIQAGGALPWGLGNLAGHR